MPLALGKIHVFPFHFLQLGQILPFLGQDNGSNPAIQPQTLCSVTSLLHAEEEKHLKSGKKTLLLWERGDSEGHLYKPASLASFLVYSHPAPRHS